MSTDPVGAHTLFLGPGTSEWAASNHFDKVWIASPRLTGVAAYPAFLDLLEPAHRLLGVRVPLIAYAARAVAPTYQELAAYGVADGLPHEPSLSELGSSDELPIRQRYLVCAAARALARVPSSHAFLIRTPEFWDMTSLEFLDRLIRETRGRRLVALATSRNLDTRPNRRERFIVTLAKGAVPVRGPSSTCRPLSRTAPHGISLAVASDLGLATGGPKVEMEGADGTPLVTGSWDELRADDLEAIFDSYPVDGWNYLRRTPFAIGAGSVVPLLRQHRLVLAGLGATGYDFLYRHLASLAELSTEDCAAASHLGAARLAPRLWGKGGRERSVRHYRAALRHLSGTETEIVVVHELANLLANGRSPAYLRRSRYWYRRAWALLDDVTDPVVRARMEVQLSNGLALVEYLEGHDAEALRLERRALEVVDEVVGLDRSVAQWADPLVKTNLSKLLLKRLNRPDEAIRLLESQQSAGEERIRRASAQNLGRAHYERGNFHDAIRYLAPRLENELTADLSESEELFDRLILMQSLVATGQDHRAAAQLPRVTYLAQMNDATELVELIGT